MEQIESPMDVGNASQPFVGEWKRLVSTSNWEKGRIIHDWRTALQKASAPVTDYSDESWAKIVGGVTGQHTGRLRRVFEKFGENRDQFSSLYWSHFQAALDWDDAEMWLEGASQNAWSVANMRRQRWQTLGAIEGEEPHDHEIVETELDEDFVPPTTASESKEGVPTVEGSDFEPRSPAGPDFGDEDELSRSSSGEGFVEAVESSVELVSPFANLNDLPEDMADAFESFKLSILRHKADQWREVTLDDTLASLEALKSLATAPSAEN